MIFVFALSFFLVVYTFALYPCLLWVIGIFFSKPIHKKDQHKDVTIVIVVFNEETNIERKVDNCFNSEYPADKIRILVASDGSNDKTVEKLKARNDSRIQVLEFRDRRGKAACLNDAILEVETEYMVLTDARQSFLSNTLKCLVSNLNDDEVGAVSGELVFSDEGSNEFSKSVDAYWRYEKFIRNAESKIGSVIGVTGAVYGLKKSYFRPIPVNTVLDDVLIPMQVIQLGKRVVFEADAIAHDAPSTDKERERNRKIRTLAGNYQLIELNKSLLNPFKNPVVIQLVSHKLLRLIIPVLLPALYISNFYLMFEAKLFVPIFALQNGFYLLPLLKRFVKGSFFELLIKVQMAFITMNWFAMLGMKEYFTNKKIHIWK